jgi:3',5'-cyclic AMP phosphodiesterase CpdA
MSSEVVIAHISDLHYPHWREGALENLQQYLKPKNPLLILVTGDLTDNPYPWQQRGLKRELDKLVKTCRDGVPVRKHQLTVVPGNHDYAVLGNWNLGLSPLARTTFSHIFRDYRRKFIEVTAGDLTVYIFCFNSNPYIARWAKGAISRRQLKWFEKRAAALRSADKDKFESAYKIAILHHHPLPIVFSEELERFLILENAGELLRRLAQWDIDLVLHGHKHQSVTSALDVGTAYGATRKLFVVSSGTTLKKGDGANTCNIITIRRRGQSEITRGRANPGEKFVDEETILLPPSGDFIAKRHALCVERVGYEIDEFVKEIEIDDEGDSLSEVRVEGLRVRDPQRFGESREEADTFDFATVAGRLIKDVVFEKSTQELRPAILEADDLRLHGSWGLPAEPDKQTDYSVQIKFLNLNAWAMTSDELERKYKPEPGKVRQEEEWFICVRPCKTFRQTIYFPERWKPEGKPSLRVYPSTDGINFSEASEDWLEKHHAWALNYDRKANTISLMIEKPIYGFKYVVGWYLPPPPASDFDDDALWSKGRVEALIERMHEAPEKMDDFMKALPEVVCSDLVNQTAPGLDAAHKEQLKEKIKREPIDISIAIPCQGPSGTQHQLQIVAQSPHREGLRNFKFNVGEGVAGRAYKLNGPRAYTRRPQERRPLVKEDYIYIPFGDSNDHTVIYSVPLRHPKRRELLVGVLSVGSRSRLSYLIPHGDNTAETISKPLIDITSIYVVQRLSDLYDGVLGI